MTAKTIFFLTDFGTADAYVGVVEAVMASIAPDARVIHLTHGVPPQDLRNGGWQLWSACPHLPDGAIVLAVVDPGVGSARRAIAVETERLTFVAPDNGLLEAALTIEAPRRAFELTEARYRWGDSATFHGRDVFGPAAAHLAAGVAATALGPEVPLASLRSLGVLPTDGEHGEVWTHDHFGNLVTTLRAPDAPIAAVELAGREIPFATHYAAVAPGEPLALAGSSGLVEISVRDGSARAALGLAPAASHPVTRR